MLPFILIPGSLDLESIRHLIQNDRKIKLADSAYQKIDDANQTLKSLLSEGKTIYGVNTGFGVLANKKIGKDELKQLQKRLILSHAAGVGKSLDVDTVKLILLLKINSLAQGYSGVSRALVDRLIFFYNQKIYADIPSQGSVGASGDLAPLAHLSLPLIGEGKVHYQGKTVPTANVFAGLDIAPLNLEEKEGLALINGTQASAGIALMGLIKAQRNFSVATIAGTLTLDSTASSIKPFHPAIAKIKKLQGQMVFSHAVFKLIEGSEILLSHQQECTKVQDPYSIRCQPQVMGAIWQQLKHAEDDLIHEANAVSDNPLVLSASREVISGGNFHAETVAFASDVISMAVSEIGAISERRIALLMDNNFSGLPAFLVRDAGLNSGFMIAHVTASALASENKTLAHPASVDSLPTSANQEDHVSMATFGAVKSNQICDNVLQILSIETLAACQGIDFKSPLKTSDKLMGYYMRIRREVPFYEKDRLFADDILKIAQHISQISYYGEIYHDLFN
ncbi:histidine ammonia-lyase [Thiotrichales bacterium 19S11-10]|nr:histidine ammonia-lyase [Thiotrichales bacterium 19S11-10]MCF6807522.1 histidine ammonia-lyase [Thiotrichales bacterium 19S9-11]MCF6811491.1 histidine ammonia-lyase [Thiotrichales bacterium 19S9-12]